MKFPDRGGDTYAAGKIRQIKEWDNVLQPS